MRDITTKTAAILNRTLKKMQLKTKLKQLKEMNLDAEKLQKAEDLRVWLYNNQIFVTVDCNRIGEFAYRVSDFSKSINLDNNWSDNTFSTYEEAMEASFVSALLMLNKRFE